MGHNSGADYRHWIICAKFTFLSSTRRSIAGDMMWKVLILGIWGALVLGSAKKRDADPALTLEALHKKYSRYIYGLCLRMLGDRFEAEDAVQETFLNAYRGFGSFHYGDDYLSWLYRIGTNVCLTMLRSRRRRRTDFVESVDENAKVTTASDDVAISRQLLERLAQELDDRSLEILAAHYVAGMEQGEVAQMLGISRRAVVKRLTALRAKVERFGIGASSHV